MFSVAGRSDITFVIDHEFILFKLMDGAQRWRHGSFLRSRDEWRGRRWASIRLARNANLTRCRSVRVFLLQGCKVVELAFRIYCLIILIALVSGHFFIAKPVSSPWPLDTNVSTWIPLRMCLPQGL